jgi:predicted MFS family arabinose efflux permease
MGAGYIFAGLTGSVIFARMLDKRRCYLKILKLICFGAFIIWTLAIFVVPLNNVPILALGQMAAGFFTIPIIPVGYQFGIEISYPVGEAMSNGVFSFMVQIVSLVVTYLGTMLCDNNKDTSVPLLGLISGLLAVSAMFTLYVKEDLRRNN